MLPEISLNVLDIVQNSIGAKATKIRIKIIIEPTENHLTLVITDNGQGMTKEALDQVEDPFYTTRTTRSVGLGIPFLKQEALSTGGSFTINSKVNEGTVVEAIFVTNHIDCMPLGNIAETVVLLMTMEDKVDVVYTYQVGQESFTLDSREVKEIVGNDSMKRREIRQFLLDMLQSNQEEIDHIVF